MSPPRCWCELCKRKGRKENRAKRGEMYWEFVGLGGGWVVASIYEPGAESESFLLLVFAVEGKGEGWESGGWYRVGFTSFLAILVIWNMHAGLWLRGFMLAGAGGGKRNMTKSGSKSVQIHITCQVSSSIKPAMYDSLSVPQALSFPSPRSKPLT